MAVTLPLYKDNVLAEAKVGFSWTTLFFGFLVPLIRGDVKWTIIMLIISICSFGLAQIILAFIYNRIYTKNLLANGYLPSNTDDRNFLVRHGFLV